MLHCYMYNRIVGILANSRPDSACWQDRSRSLAGARGVGRLGTFCRLGRDHTLSVLASRFHARSCSKTSLQSPSDTWTGVGQDFVFVFALNQLDTYCTCIRLLPPRVKETVMLSPVHLVTQLLDENATIVNETLCIVANGVDPGCSVFPNRNLSMFPN